MDEKLLDKILSLYNKHWKEEDQVSPEIIELTRDAISITAQKIFARLDRQKTIDSVFWYGGVNIPEDSEEIIVILTKEDYQKIKSDYLRD
jgi:hypothetical protein